MSRVHIPVVLILGICLLKDIANVVVNQQVNSVIAEMKCIVPNTVTISWKSKWMVKKPPTTCGMERENMLSTHLTLN